MSHRYSFQGADYLNSMGLSWFVSYAYYTYVDKTHRNWEKHPERCSIFENSRSFHQIFLEEIRKANPALLERNGIGLTGNHVICMVKEILTKLPFCKFLSSTITKSQFSERLFETLMNHELLNKLKCDIYIPSQSKEAKSGLDALFQRRHKKLLALQYKIVIEDKRNTDKLPLPCYRFNLHKRNQFMQHNLLVKKAKRGLLAGYAVPLFVSYDDLFSAYHSRNLLNYSRLIIPHQKIHDSKSHYIAYNCSKAFQHSRKATNLSIESFSSILSKLETTESYSKEDFINLFIEDEIFSENDFEKVEKQIETYLAINRISLFAL